MKYSIAAALLAAPAAVLANGSAIVINQCAYPVSLNNVPSADGGGDPITQTINANGGSYSQQYQSLSNGNGWSLKLAKEGDSSDVMQFEYTLQGSTLWFDISDVNGRPFEGQWFISSSSPECVVKQTAYQYSTDDANGMQPSCSSSTSVTVTLCSSSGGGASSGGAGGLEADAASVASVAAPTKIKAPKPPAPSTTLMTSTRPNKAAIQASKSSAAAASKAAAEAAKSASLASKVLTQVVTQVVTVEVTATAKSHHNHHRDIHMHKHLPLRHQHAHI